MSLRTFKPAINMSYQISGARSFTCETLEAMTASDVTSGFLLRQLVSLKVVGE